MMGNIFRRLWSTTTSAEAHQVPAVLIPDEILEDIFLRLDDAADVARASAACKSHRRVVCNRRFLRRYRFLHPPPVLGFLESMGNGRGFRFHPAETPHKSAPAAASLAQAADFTFSFLLMDPNYTYNRRWCVCDARDGRVLLFRRSADDSATFLDLVICDPLYRRYVEIPSIPEDLWAKRYSTKMKSEPFLLPAREEEDESQFRVIYNLVCRYKIITFLYSFDTREWCLGASFSFLPERLITNPKNFVRYYAGSCFYWVDRNYSSNYMLVLDPLEMAFSITGIPYGTRDNGQGAVVDAGVNRLGIIVLGYVGNLDLHSKAWQKNGCSTQEWQHDKHHTLPEGYKAGCHIIGAAEGCLVLVDCSVQRIQYSIMDPKTFLVERFCKSKLVFAVDRVLDPVCKIPTVVVTSI